MVLNWRMVTRVSFSSSFFGSPQDPEKLHNLSFL